MAESGSEEDKKTMPCSCCEYFKSLVVLFLNTAIYKNEHVLLIWSLVIYASPIAFVIYFCLLLLDIFITFIILAISLLKHLHSPIRTIIGFETYKEHRALKWTLSLFFTLLFVAGVVLYGLSRFVWEEPAFGRRYTPDDVVNQFMDTFSALDLEDLLDLYGIENITGPDWMPDLPDFNITLPNITLPNITDPNITLPNITDPNITLPNTTNGTRRVAGWGLGRLLGHFSSQNQFLPDSRPYRRGITSVAANAATVAEYKQCIEEYYEVARQSGSARWIIRLWDFFELVHLQEIKTILMSLFVWFFLVRAILHYDGAGSLYLLRRILDVPLTVRVPWCQAIFGSTTTYLSDLADALGVIEDKADFDRKVRDRSLGHWNLEILSELSETEMERMKDVFCNHEMQKTFEGSWWYRNTDLVLDVLTCQVCQNSACCQREEKAEDLSSREPAQSDEELPEDQRQSGAHQQLEAPSASAVDDSDDKKTPPVCPILLGILTVLIEEFKSVWEFSFLLFLDFEVAYMIVVLLLFCVYFAVGLAIAFIANSKFLNHKMKIVIVYNLLRKHRLYKVWNFLVLLFLGVLAYLLFLVSMLVARAQFLRDSENCTSNAQFGRDLWDKQFWTTPNVFNLIQVFVGGVWVFFSIVSTKLGFDSPSTEHFREAVSDDRYDEDLNKLGIGWTTLWFTPLADLLGSVVSVLMVVRTKDDIDELSKSQVLTHLEWDYLAPITKDEEVTNLRRLFFETQSGSNASFWYRNADIFGAKLAWQKLRNAKKREEGEKTIETPVSVDENDVSTEMVARVPVAVQDDSAAQELIDQENVVSTEMVALAIVDPGSESSDRETGDVPIVVSLNDRDSDSSSSNE